MKVKILKTVNGSINGIQVIEFKEGETYDTEKGEISDSLVKVFTNGGFAEKVKDEPITEPKKVSYEKKVIKPKENKKKK